MGAASSIHIGSSLKARRNSLSTKSKLRIDEVTSYLQSDLKRIRTLDHSVSEMSQFLCEPEEQTVHVLKTSRNMKGLLRNADKLYVDIMFLSNPGDLNPRDKIVSPT
jgi:hypothetical protein